MNSQVDDRGQNLNETERFSKSNEEEPNTTKDKEKEEIIAYLNQCLQAASSREKFAAEINQKLLNELNKIISQMIQENWVLSFQTRVNANSLVYSEICNRFPNLGTIMERMSHKCYKHVTEAYDDVRAQFEASLKKHEEDSYFDRVIRLMLVRFESKWKEIAPNTIEEEIQSKEKAQTQLEMELAYRKISQFKEVDTQLKELKDQIFQKCGKMDIKEKRQILVDIKRLSHDELTSALGIVARNNGLCFDAATDALVQLNENDAILWELLFFLKDKKRADSRNCLSSASVLSDDMGMTKEIDNHET